MFTILTCWCLLCLIRILHRKVRSALPMSEFFEAKTTSHLYKMLGKTGKNEPALRFVTTELFEQVVVREINSITPL